MTGASAPSIVIVVGNPKVNSRTLDAARSMADAIAEAVGWNEVAVTTVVDLAEVTSELFDWGSERVRSNVDALRTARLAVIASPVYKATYSGLLKAFLDRVGQGELHEVVVVPLMVGAAANHALAVEVHLRPLLAELGAVLPTRGVFLLESQLVDLRPAIDAWLTSESHTLRIRRALGVSD